MFHLSFYFVFVVLFICCCFSFFFVFAKVLTGPYYVYICYKDPDQTVRMLIILIYQTPAIPHST